MQINSRVIARRSTRSIARKANVLCALLGALVVLHALFLAPPAAAAPNNGSELCPIASDRANRSVGYRSSSNVIRAPVTAADTAELLTSLQNAAGETRTIAIMRLALAGDLATFRLLLASADIDGVYIYASQYLNHDGSVCLDKELESAVLDHLADGDLGHRLVALLSKNTYRNISLLHALREVPFESSARQANRYLSFGRAITSTNLRDIEADVLAHARGLLPLDSPVKKSTLPGLHQHYVKFFAERGYVDAVGYFRELLTQARRDEPIQSFQINYGMLRTTVLQGLGALGGNQAHGALIGELEAIASEPLDAFAASELQTIGKLVLTLTQPGEKQRVVAAFQRLLQTAQPARYDYPMRRTIYSTLSGLNSVEGTALLLAELTRYMGSEPLANRQAALANLFEALRNLQDLDVEPLFDLVDNASSSSTRSNIWQLAQLHPSAAGVDFLLAELRFSLGGGVQTGKVLDRQASSALLDMLAALQATEFQNRARDGIDTIFDEGMLAESDYLRAVTKLNKALGNESPRYVALRAEQARERVARQQAAVAQGKREMRAEYAAELARHSSTEGIAANIANLSANGSDSRRAVQWLVIVGDAALEQLHAALGAADIMDQLRFQLINVLGEIGNPGSTAPLIAAAETSKEGGFQRPVFFALALIPPTAESLEFANAQLANAVSERRQIAALVYLAQIRHAPAEALVARFSAAGLSPRLRSAGLYLGARLGVAGIAGAVTTALQRTQERAELDMLLTTLAEAATDPAEFTRVANAAGFSERSLNYRKNLAYCTFRTAPREAKVAMAREVMADGNQWQRREAIRYLIATDPQGTIDLMTDGIGQFLPLHKLMPLSSGSQLLFSESRRMGYELRQTEAGYVLSR